MKIKAVYLALLLVLLFSLVATIVPSGTAKAATLCVNPGGTGGCYNSIQDAINNANPVGGDTIVIAPGTYEEYDITVNFPVTIQGAGEDATIVDGKDMSRVLYIDANVNIYGITIRNGNTSTSGGGVYIDSGTVTLTNCSIIENQSRGESGGGIYNRIGNATLTACTVSDNHADDDGGGIYNDDGSVTLTNCTISGNTAGDEGGGIWTGGVIIINGTLIMTNCIISGNKADEGGGIFNSGDKVIMTSCTVSDNTARNGDGGGISTVIEDLTVTMTNCTISGNNASGDGGGIYNFHDEVTLTNCTVSRNHADDEGGGIYNSAEVGNVTMTCTIVYDNTAGFGGPNIVGSYTDAGGESIVGSPDPLLGPLQDNGGPTETHALLTGSPAIDTCINCTVVAILNGPGFGLPLVIDQRWRPRPVDGDLDGDAFCDVGAYEKQVTVGGIVEQVDKIGILAPWLGLVAFIVVAMAAIVLLQRRRMA